MAIIEVKVPQLSESVAEATLLDWHKKEGEPAAGAGPATAAPGAAAAGAADRSRRDARRPAGAARADVAPAPACRRAPGAVAVDRGDPHHVQRSEHAAGGRDAQEVPGALRERARHAAWLHVVLRKGGGARAPALPGGQLL